MKRTETKYLHPRSVVNTIYYLLPLLTIGVVLYFIPELYHLVGIFFLSFLTSYLLRPPIEFLQHRGFTRQWATVVVFIMLALFLLTVIVGFTPLIWRQAVNLRETLGQLQVEELLESKGESAGSTFGVMTYLQQLESSLGFIPGGTFREQISRVYEWGLQNLTGFLINLGVVFWYVILIPLLAFFLVRDQRQIEKFLLRAVPNMFFEMTYNIYQKVDAKIGQYVRGLAMEALVIALASTVVLYLLGVPYAVTTGIFIGLTNVVPYIGPIVGAVPALIVQFIETDDFLAVLAVGIALAVVQFFDNLVVKPVMFSRSMSLHPLVVILVIIAGGQLAGVLGMILGIPVLASVWVIFREFSWAVNNYRFEK